MFLTTVVSAVAAVEPGLVDDAPDAMEFPDCTVTAFTSEAVAEAEAATGALAPPFVSTVPDTIRAKVNCGLLAINKKKDGAEQRKTSF